MHQQDFTMKRRTPSQMKPGKPCIPPSPRASRTFQRRYLLCLSRTSLSRPLHAVSHKPYRWTRASANVVFESDHDAGGHFAAFEKPELLAADLKRMFRKNGGVKFEA